MKDVHVLHSSLRSRGADNFARACGSVMYGRFLIILVRVVANVSRYSKTGTRLDGVAFCLRLEHSEQLPMPRIADRDKQEVEHLSLAMRLHAVSMSQARDSEP
jgi:hypothetical protein